MKKLFTILLLSIFVVPVALAKDEFTLKCSYITQFSDFHITMDAFTLTKKYKVLNPSNKIIGYFEILDNDPTKLEIFLDNGPNIYFDTKKGLSIFTVQIEGENVYSFGSCSRMK